MATQERVKIFAEIEAERDYQTRKFGTAFDDKNTSTDWIAFIASCRIETTQTSSRVLG
jgi:hypothetical protein